MNVTKPLYPHESDKRIMMKKDTMEVNIWVDELKHANEEFDYLLSLEGCSIRSSQLCQELQELRRKNQFLVGELYRYESGIHKVLECDTMECDAFYLQRHEENRIAYIGYLQQNREVKLRVLTNALKNLKR